METDTGYTDLTSLQMNSQFVRATDATGGGATVCNVISTANTYAKRWDMLESQQLTQVVTTRYAPNGSTALGSTTQNYVFDPATSGSPLLQLVKTYLDGGAIGQHGNTYTYDSDGRPQTQQVFHVEGTTALTSPNTTTLTFDATTGLLTSQSIKDTTSGGTLSTNLGGFNSLGLPTTQTDPSSVTTTYAYDDRGRTLSVAKPGTPTTTYSYPTELMVQVTVNGQTTTISYDGFGRVLTKFIPSGIAANYGTTRYTIQNPTYDQYGRQVALNGMEWSQNFYGDASSGLVGIPGKPYSTFGSATTDQIVTSNTLALVHTHPLFGRLGIPRVQIPSNPDDFQAAAGALAISPAATNIMLSSIGIFTYGSNPSSVQQFGGKGWWNLPDCPQ